MNSTSNTLGLSYFQHIQLPAQLQSLGQRDLHNPRTLLALICVVILGIYVATATPWKRQKAPASLFDPIPYVFNTFQFIFWNERFLNRASTVLERARVVKFHLFQTPVYLISGQQSIQTLFSRSHNVGSENMYMEHVFPNLYGMPKQDVQRFIRDKSGRDRVPPPGFEKMTSEQRVWAGYDKVHSDLSKSQNFRPVAEFFSQSMAQALDEWYPVEEWQSVSLIDFCRNRVAAKGVEALFGTRMFELNPDLIDAFWAFDSNLFVLTLGLSRWVHFRAYRARDRYYGMIRNYLDDASGRTPHDNEAFWSGIIDWFKDNEFDDRVGVGAMAIVMFAALSNTVPIMMWIIMEVIRDPALLQALREEVATAYTTDSRTGENMLDIGKVSALPLLQSVLTEVLRLHMNFNLIRNVNQPIVVDGFTIPRGVMLQAPMRTAHYDEVAWGSEGHPAAEFWAERHVTWKEVQDESGNTIKQRAFAMAARPTSFFPFGGSHEICPGRHLAKHEILTVVALLISKFDMEIEGWTQKDGSPSQRAAKNDSRFSGAGAQPPDRDLKMRWRRRQ